MRHNDVKQNLLELERKTREEVNTAEEISTNIFFPHIRHP